MPTGSLVVVVLLHVPYVRRAGVWPFGESQLFGALADAFLPFLDRILDLQENPGPAPRLTLALSPVLAEQLSDPILRSGFEEFMLRRLADHAEAARALPEPLAAVARWHRDRDERLLDSWSGRHRRDLVRTVRELAHAGAVEVVTLPGTAAILPILPRAGAAEFQVKTGLLSAERHLEHRPLGMWLPGGAIAPRGAFEPMEGADRFRGMLLGGERDWEMPGTDETLRWQEVDYAIAAERALQGVRPDPAGPSPLDVHRTSAGLALLTRHDGLHDAWFDPHRGFPASPGYLGPPDDAGGRYLARGNSRAVGERTAPQVDADPMARPYDPVTARELAASHAQDAVATARSVLADHQRHTGHPGILVMPVDARLFETWTEGPDWVADMLIAARDDGLALQSGAEAVHGQTVFPLPDLHPASWEAHGDFRHWRAPNTTWYWDVVASVLDTAESLVDRFASSGHPLVVRALAQAMREASLLVSGEWAAMLGAGGEGRDYAAERVRSHHDRFRLLSEMLLAEDFGEGFDTALLERFEELDSPFEAFDYDRHRVLPAPEDEPDLPMPEPPPGRGAMGPRDVL